jgi:predicted Zn-dependent protease
MLAGLCAGAIAVGGEPATTAWAKGPNGPPKGTPGGTVEGRAELRALNGLGTLSELKLTPAEKAAQQKERALGKQLAIVDYTVLSLRDYKQAVVEIKKALAIDPNNLRVNMSLVDMYLRLDQRKEALALLEKLQKKNPTEASIPRAIAMVKLNGGDQEGSIASLKKVLEVNPSDWEVQFALFQFAYKKMTLGDAAAKNDAVSYAKGFLKSCPFRRGLQYQMAERAVIQMAGTPLELTLYDAKWAYQRAFAETGFGRINALMNQARKGFEDCVAQQPQNQACHYYLGMIYGSVKASDAFDEKKSIAELQKAPDLADAQIDLAVAMRRRDENAAAERCLKRALELEPNNARAMLELGIIEKLDGKTEDAVNLFANAVRADLGSPSGARALDELTKLRPDHDLARMGALRGPMPIDIFSSERFLAAISLIEQQFGGVDESAAETPALREIVNRLLHAAEVSPSKMPRVAVLATRNIENAFALPNGNVYVTRALLDSFRKEWPDLPINADHGPLAQVLAHELAHVTRQHAAQSMLYVEAVQDAGARIDPSILTHTTRLQEIEADRVGMITAFVAGYHPRAGIDFMAAMGKKMEIPSHLDHPTFDERVHYLEEFWSNDVKYAFQAFKSGLGKIDKATELETSDSGAALGLYKDALEDFRRFRDTVRPSKEVLNNMGVAYARMGVLAQARAASTLSRWQTPLSLERQTALKYKSLVDGAERGTGGEVPWQLAQAAELFQEALSKDDGYRRAALNLAIAQIAIGTPDKALASLGKLAAATGNDAADASNVAGVAHAALGHVPDAEKAFKAALAAQKDQPAALFNLGRLYQTANKKGDAQSAWKNYLAHYPTGPWADAAKAELAAK